MRYEPYLLAGVWLSACALPHLEQRDEAAASAGESGASLEPAAAGHAHVGGAAGRAGEGALTSGSDGHAGGSIESEAGSGGSAGVSGAASGSGGSDVPEGGGAPLPAGGASSGAPGSGGSAGCATKNACGGCAVLAGAVGDICAGCGKLSCNGFEALMCAASCVAPKAECNTTTNQCVACVSDMDCTMATPVCSTNGVCLLCKPSSSGCSGTTPTSCNATGTVLTPGPVHAGICGAKCEPGVSRCNNLVGERCAFDGTGYVSSGSNAMCNCTDSGGRFKFVTDKQVKDANTGLTWDFPGHAADTYAGASGTCSAKGMRLPTQAELEGLLLSAASATTCSQKLLLAIDSVAFPGITPVNGGGVGNRYWTKDAESGFPGYYFVVYFYGPTNTTSPSGFGTTDRTASDLVPFQCVLG